MSAPDHAPVSDHSGHAADPGHSSGRGHASDEDALGPVDVVAWAYALAGGALGLLVALALYAASTTSG